MDPHLHPQLDFPTGESAARPSLALTIYSPASAPIKSVEQRMVLDIRAGLQFMMGNYQTVKQSSIVVTLSVGPSQTAAAHITPGAFLLE